MAQPGQHDLIFECGRNSHPHVENTDIPRMQSHLIDALRLKAEIYATNTLGISNTSILRRIKLQTTGAVQRLSGQIVTLTITLEFSNEVNIISQNTSI